MIGPTEEFLVPTRITVGDELKGITFEYPNGVLNKFSCEFLRVYSPSAEVVGHGPGQRKNPTGKNMQNAWKIKEKQEKVKPWLWW